MKLGPGIYSSSITHEQYMFEAPENIIAYLWY